MRPRLLAGVLFLALALVPVAGAAIVVNKGIGGVTIGLTEAQVRGKLGDPASVKRGSNDFGPYTTLRYKTPAIRVTFQGNVGATAIETTSPGQRTASGVGVGSAEAQVRAKVAGVRCETESGFRHCYVGAFLPGRRVTDFWIKRGKVTRVVVGIVID